MRLLYESTDTIETNALRETERCPSSTELIYDWFHSKLKQTLLCANNKHGIAMSGSISPPLLETVARRACVINHLLEDPADKRELETVLDVSRTTVDRAISDLKDIECIIDRDGKWEVTLFGRLVYEEYKQLVTRYESLNSARPLLRHLSTETSLDVCLLVGADILLADQPAPHAPVTRLEELLQNSQQIKGISPVVIPIYVELFYQQIIERETDTDLILNDELVEYLWANYPNKMDAVLSTDNGRVWWLNQGLPFGFVLIDDEVVWFAVYDDNGGLKGAIVNDTDAAVTWAADVFHTFRQQSEQVLVRGGSHSSIHV